MVGLHLKGDLFMDFRIGAKIEEEPLKSKFVIHCSNMSGDADHYEETTTILESSLDVARFVRLYATYWLMDYEAKYQEKNVLTEVQRVGDELGFNESAIDTYVEMVGYDITTEGILAAPDSLSVVYHDANGNRFFVELLGDGSCITSLTQGNIKRIFP